MPGEYELVGEVVTIAHMSGFDPGFYVHDDCPMDAHLIYVAADHTLYDLGKVALVNYTEGYGILANPRRRIEFADYDKYTIAEPTSE